MNLIRLAVHFSCGLLKSDTKYLDAGQRLPILSTSCSCEGRPQGFCAGAYRGKSGYQRSHTGGFVVLRLPPPSEYLTLQTGSRIRLPEYGTGETALQLSKNNKASKVLKRAGADGWSPLMKSCGAGRRGRDHGASRTVELLSTLLTWCDIHCSRRCC